MRTECVQTHHLQPPSVWIQTGDKAYRHPESDQARSLLPSSSVSFNPEAGAVEDTETILQFKVSLDNLGLPGNRKPTDGSDHLSKLYEIKGAGRQEQRKARKKETEGKKEKQTESMNCLIGTGFMNYVVAWGSWLREPGFIHTGKARKITLRVGVALYYYRKVR